MGGFGDADEEHGERDPPDVVAELGAQLLVHEVAARVAGCGCSAEEVVPDEG